MNTLKVIIDICFGLIGITLNAMLVTIFEKYTGENGAIFVYIVAFCILLIVVIRAMVREKKSLNKKS